jgi:hypothetical protein
MSFLVLPAFGTFPDVQLRTLYGGGEIASMSDKLPAEKRNIGISVRAIGRWKGESM